jgi:multisubunit Na+/H+ antiporter MnhC subunit
MADVDINGAIGAGFSLIRRRPLAVLAWGLVEAIAFGVLLAGYIPFFGFMAGLAHDADANGGAASQAESLQLVRGMAGVFGFVFLAFIVMIVIRAVVTSAVWRAVLHPERSAWAYLRLGVAELYVLLLAFAAGVAGQLILLPAMPLEFVVIGLAVAHQYVAAVIVAILGVVAIFAAVIYFALRFSVLGPMIVDTGRFAFAEAWALTRGMAGRLFFVGFGLFCILLVLEALLAIAVGGVGLFGLTAAAGGLDSVPALFHQPPATIALKLWPLAAVWILGAIPVGGGFTAIVLAPWARAYADLRHDLGEVLA